MKKILNSLIFRKTIDFLVSPLTLLASVWFKFIRLGKGGDMRDMPISEFIFNRVGVLPVTDHYYQPLVNPKKHLTQSLRKDRSLPGIDFNIIEQLELLNQFKYNEEILNFPIEKTSQLEYYFNNNSFVSGDAEYLYNIIRHFKPRKIIEVGSGFSTLMALNAVKKNAEEDTVNSCQQICIEPYEMPWLEKTGVTVIRKKIEVLDKSIFQQLGKNDILFIDSSHMIRPQGDVLFEFLEILPVLKSGVIVHIHDIFTPKDYLDEWVFHRHLLWNEQYLLEAFLTSNSTYRIIGALNFLTHNHFEHIAGKCPIMAKQSGCEPGSFWMIKN